MPVPPSRIYSEPYAGLQAQALGLAEAAGLSPAMQDLRPRPPFHRIPARFWPNPLAAARVPPPPEGELAITTGGMGGAVGAALRRAGHRVVQVQNPRMALRRFDLVVANRHDEIAGPNVITTRTALHRATPARLAQARQDWLPRFAALPRPLVAVLLGGSNGRYTLEVPQGEALARGLATIMREDQAGMAVTPSRRTAGAVCRHIETALRPLGAYVWDGAGENPYFGMLACADAIIVTTDSISMVSEAVATQAPVLVVTLPGRSRRIELFLRGLRGLGRVRDFAGRLELWPVLPLDDTDEAAAEMRRRLGF